MTALSRRQIANVPWPISAIVFDWVNFLVTSERLAGILSPTTLGELRQGRVLENLSCISRLQT